MASRLEEINQPISSLNKAGRAFKHYNFKVLFIGEVISFLGTWSQAIAMSWLVWKLTGSAKWLGIASFSSQIPVLFFGLFGGVLADRYDRRKQLIITNGIFTFLAAILALLTLTNSINVWLIILINFLAGISLAIEIPTRNAFTMDVVGKADLVSALSIFSGVFHGTRLVGPVLAGLIVGMAGEGMCFAFNSLTFAVLVVILLFFIRKSEIQPVEKNYDDVLTSLKEGLSYLKFNPVLRLALIMISLVAMIQFSYIALMPIFADKVYKGSALELGYLNAALAVGSVIGSWYLAQRKKQHNLLTLSMKHNILFGLSLFFFSIQRDIYIALAILVFVGYTITVGFTAVHTLIQRIPPDHMRGRMVSLVVTAFMGLAPFGSLGGGYLADMVGVQNTISIFAFFATIVSLFAFSRAKEMENVM